MLDTYNFSIIIDLCIIGVANIARLDCCQTFAGFSCAHKWNQAKTEDQANHIKCHEWLTYRPPCTAPHKSPGCQHDTPGTSNNAHIIILSWSVGAINRHPTVPCARSSQCRCAVACRHHNVHYLCGACCPCSAVCLVNNSHAWPGSVELTAAATTTVQRSIRSILCITGYLLHIKKVSVSGNSAGREGDELRV